MRTGGGPHDTGGGGAAPAGGERYALALRVYYQDTDAGGVVFHAGYLSFFERARTELLRSLGFDIGRLAGAGVLFAVHRIEVEYLRPARLDQQLTVTARIARLGRSSARFEQTALGPGGELLVRGLLDLVCVSAQAFRPVAMPAALRDQLRRYA